MFPKSFQHWSLRYFFDLFCVRAFEVRNPDAPWLTREAVEFLAGWLLKDYNGLEWGSGKSTLWFAKYAHHLISIEHHAGWFREISLKLKKNKLDNVTYYHCPDISSGASEYVKIAHNFSKESFDFILIDGELRDHCALAAIPLVKPGGLLMIDNVNRYLPNQSRSPESIRKGAASRDWFDFSKKVYGWTSFWTSNGVCDTAWWFKP